MEDAQYELSDQADVEKTFLDLCERPSGRHAASGTSNVHTELELCVPRLATSSLRDPGYVTSSQTSGIPVLSWRYVL